MLMLPVRPSLLRPALAALLAFPAIGVAQSRTSRDTVPLTMLPPAGKCRIWMAGVPAAQQPAPTDCSTALRQKPANGVLLYGPTQRDADAERFDPQVGQDARTTKSSREQQADERRNGSPAEQALERQRQQAERARLIQEMRERDERNRREANERASLMGRSGGAGGTTTSAPRGTTAVPRTGAGNSTAGTGGSAGTKTAEPKSPPENKRKPE